MIIDSHVHLNDEAFIDVLDLYFKESEEANVKAFLCIGNNLKTSKEAVKIANKYKNVYAAVGIHPSDLYSMGEDDFNEIEKLVENKKVIAIGEVGLDFYWTKEKDKQQIQIDWFKKFISLANKYNLPIIIHSRDAINLTYEILRGNKVNKAGIIHCYSGGKDYVKRYVEMGYFFGIGGVVTFKNAISVKEAVKEIPLDRLLLETDAPYLAPSPHRGENNHSKYLPLVINELATLKNVTAKEIEDRTTNNFIRLFNLK